LLSSYWGNFREADDYAKWQLLLNEFVLSAASLGGDDDWGILWKAKFPKTSKLGESATLACVEFIETAMPFAVARPFVEEFVTDNTRNIVSYIFNYLSFLMGVLGCFLVD